MPHHDALGRRHTMAMAPEWQMFSKPGERAGLALIATAGLVSALTSGALLSYIVWNSFLVHKKPRPLARGVRSFMRSPLGFYLLSLLLCDLAQGIAFTLNYRWSARGFMDSGRVCTVQGAVSEVGDLGAALWSMAIAFHTFWLLFLARKPHRITAPLLLVGGWSLLIFLPIIGPLVIQKQARGSFYSLSGAWCWVGTGYGKERLIYLYGWIFAALGSSFVIYTLIYLRFSNIITLGDNGKLKLHFRRPNQQPGTSLSQGNTGTSRRLSSSLPGCFDWGRDTRDHGGASSGTGSGGEQASEGSKPPVGKHLKHIARRLMWYPIVYAVVVLPVSVCRMGVLAGWNPPFGLLVFAGICFGSSGVTNTVLFITTRHAFIKEVAKRDTTRVHITKQRIIVREAWASTGQDDVELSDMKFVNGATFSPNTPSAKFEYFENMDSPEYLVDGKDKVMDHAP